MHNGDNGQIMPQPRVVTATGPFAGRSGAPSAMPLARQRFATRLDTRHHDAIVKSLFTNGIAGSETLGDLFGLFSGSLGRYSGLQETEALVDPMVQEPWFAASVNLLAGTVAKVPLELFDDDPRMNKSARELPTDHPIARLFASPSPFTSAVELRKHDAVNMSLSGESVWLLADDNGEPVTAIGSYLDAYIDTPTRIIPLRGDMVQEVRDPHTRQIVGFRVPRAGGRGLKFWPAGAVIIHYEIPDHRRPGRGLSRATQAWGSASASYLARRYNSVWLGNLGDPGGVLTVDGWLTDEQYRRLQSVVDEEWNSKERAGEVRLLEGGASFSSNTAKPRDMAFDQLLRSNQDEITAVTGTPRGLLAGDVENYATLRGHMRTFVVLREEPFSSAIADKLNSQFFPRLRDPAFQRIRCRFDRTALLKMVADAKEQGDGAVQLTRAGMSPNMALRHAGVQVDEQDLDPSGDVPFISKGFVPMASQLAGERARVLEQVGKSLKALTDARVPDAVAVRLVSDAAGIEGIGTLEEREPPPQLNPAAPGDAPRDEVDEPGDDADDGEDDEDGAKAAAPGAGVVTRAAPSRRQLTALWNRWEKVVAPHRRALGRKLRSKLWAMRAAQLAAIAKFAETGEFPKRSWPALPVVGFVASGTLAQLERAIAADDAERASLEAAGEDPGAVSMLCCDGEVRVVHRDWSPRLDDVLRRHARLNALGRDRVRAVIDCRKASVSEEELDRLVIVAGEKFKDEIAAILNESALSAWEAGASFTRAEVGLAALESTPPEVVQALGRRSVALAGDTTGQLAQRIRTRMARALAGVDDATGSLTQQIKAALDEVRAGTTGAFSSHRARAQAIAHTETASAANEARAESLVEAHADGIVSVLRWVTSGRGEAPQGTVRSSHFRIEANEEAVVPGQTFSNGLRWPLDPEATDASEVVNCQCTVVADTTD